MEKSQHTIKINPVKTAVLLFIISFVVLVFSLLGQRPYETGSPTEKFFRELFTTEFFVNNGENIATYWNMVILAVASLLIFMVAAIRNAQKDKFRYGWYVLGGIFAFSTIDALAGVSHRFAQLLRALPAMEGGFLYNWLFPVTAVFLLFLLFFFVWFYLRLDAQNKFLFPIAMILYILGAYKAQLISAYYGSLYGTTTTAFLLISHAEELAEYVGVILMIYFLLTYIASLVTEVEFTA